MGRKRKKKRSSTPRRKTMNRTARLQSAVKWLKEYDGKNYVRGYCRWFGVDWRSAAIELKQLGVKIDEKYLVQRAKTEQELIKNRKLKKKEQKIAESEREQSILGQYDPIFHACLAGDDAPLHAFEMEKLEDEDITNDDSQSQLFLTSRDRLCW